MKIVQLGGRQLQVIASANIAHDYWLTKQIRLAGIDKVEIDPKREAADIVEAILDRVIESGAAMTLLGGLLAPPELEAKDWTPAIATECTAFLNGLVAEEDRIVVRGLVADTVLSFFHTGLVSLRTSRISSPSRRGPGLPKSTNRTAAS